jgi:hypothetical protein
MNMSDSDTQKPRTCYLAASIDSDLKLIEELLVEKQIQPVVSADLSLTAATFLESIVNAISSADLFIALLNAEQSNENIYVELGIAIAKERRILIVTPPGRSLMVDIAELPVIRADITNRDALSFMLDQVLMEPPRKFRPQLPRPITQKGRPIGDFADELLVALDQNVRETEMIQLLMRALKESGYSTIAHESLLRYDRRADLIIWSDEFGPWIGNPLIIEVKKTFDKTVNWSAAVQQVLSYLQVSQTRSALILYANALVLPENLSSIAPPNIFFLDMHQLFNSMRMKSFAEVMVDLRNRRVHGKDAL